jgi:protein SCO1/2
MAGRTQPPGPPSAEQSLLDGPFRLVVAMAAVMVIAVVGRALLDAGRSAGSGTGTVSPSASPVDLASFLLQPAGPAPELALTDQDGAPFRLSSQAGRPMLVFFGYTHCPDVCPATVGIMSQVLASYGHDLGAVFVTVDPERDTVPWLKEYVRYLPKGFTAVTGTAAEVRTAADAWGVRYARVDEPTPGAYSMTHTATVFLVSADGRLSGRFPFGTSPEAMLAFLRTELPTASAGAASSAGAAPSAAPSAPPASPAAGPTLSAAPVDDMAVDVVSSSVWAGGSTPVILALFTAEGRIADLAASVSVQLTTTDGSPQGAPVTATAVRPEGVAEVSYVAFLDIPTSGWWNVVVSAGSGGTTWAGFHSVSALDPGGTAALGGPAPAVRTPTLADVGGRPLAVTTDPIPDLRMYTTSTGDALAAGQPFVLVVDSVRFRVTPVCGKAVVLAKYLLDRWTGMTFIHLEPYKYDVVTDTAVLEGSLGAPTIVPAAEAWGVAAEPWGAGSMPWIFIVDGHGIVRAKYQGIVGSADVDVLLTYLAARG